jgi:hypothetical protein
MVRNFVNRPRLFWQTGSIIHGQAFTNPCLALAKDGVASGPALTLCVVARAKCRAVAPQPARACLPSAPAMAAATPSTDPWLAAARAQNAERRSMLLASAAHTGSQSIQALPPTPNTELFFKDATHNSASRVPWGIPIDLEPWRPTFEKCSHLREKGGVLTQIRA